jgi:hypothetical protein
MVNVGGSLTVADVKNATQSAPKDLLVQMQGCSDLAAVSKDRSLEAKSPYGGNYIPTKFLLEGIGEVYAQAILNILANKEATEEDIYKAAQSCVEPIWQVLQTQNDAEKGLAKFNSSPHLWDATVGFYKRFWKTHYPKGTCLFAGLYGTFVGSEAPASGFARAGGVELLLEWVDHSRTSPDLLQTALCALSDNIQSSAAVVDAIDRHDGAKRLTEAVRTIHLTPNQFIDGNGFSLHYEILEDICGMLQRDVKRKYATAFIDAGLIDAIIEYMPDDQGDLYFQDHACQTLGWLSNQNATLQRMLKESAAVRQLVKGAVDLHCKPNCTWPPVLVFTTGSNAVQPPPTCKHLLKNLESSEEELWVEQLSEGGWL